VIYSFIRIYSGERVSGHAYRASDDVLIVTREIACAASRSRRNRLAICALFDESRILRIPRIITEPRGEDREIPSEPDIERNEHRTRTESSWLEEAGKFGRIGETFDRADLQARNYSAEKETVEKYRRDRAHLNHEIRKTRGISVRT
jgi:hypothetical protein